GPVVVVLRNVQAPRLERVFLADQAGSELREVATQYIDHGGVVDPVQTGLRIHFGSEVLGVEAVGHQAARSVHDEDLERGLAEGKAFRTHGFSQLANQGVDLLDVVVVDALQFRERCRISGQVLELGDRGQANLATEFVVTRYATLTVTQYVHGRQVKIAAQRNGNVAQEIRIVVQRQRTRVGDTEGVPQAVGALGIHHAFSATVAGILDRDAVGNDVGADVIHVDVVTHQRVHAVNSGEFFRQGVGSAVVVRLRSTNNATDGVGNAASACVTRVVRVVAGDQLNEAVDIGGVLVV